MSARSFACIACLLAQLSAGCTSQRPATHPPHGGPPPAAADAGPLRPPDALAFDFQWRQRVTASWPDGKRSFDAVLQKRGGELVLVGLSPLGQAGFVLRLRAGGAIEVENHSGQQLPFPPAFILADVQRVFFPWLPPPAADFSGERAADVAGLHIVERCLHGRVQQRSFTRASTPDRSVQIRYEHTGVEHDAAERVVLDNGWFGYRLVIETLEQSRLD